MQQYPVGCSQKAIGSVVSLVYRVATSYLDLEIYQVAYSCSLFNRSYCLLMSEQELATDYVYSVGATWY